MAKSYRNELVPTGALLLLGAYADDGHELRSGEARLQNLLDHAPAWIIIAEPLLDRYLDANFGRRNLDRIKLRPIAMFEKPGASMRLAIYQATSP